MTFLQWVKNFASLMASPKSAVRRLDRNHALAQELLHPEWTPIEEHFGAPVPATLKQFYSDPNQLLQLDFTIVSLKSEILGGLYIEFFEKMGLGSVDGFFEGFERFIPLARGCGAELCVIDPTEADPEVFLHIYDIGADPEHFRSTGLRLSGFLRAKRVPAGRLPEEL